MNYFAHAIRFLDRPYFMAGLAVPDWLSVVDRKSRVRSKTLLAQRDAFSGDDLEVLDGIQKHLDDDQWFHGTPGFFSVMGHIGQQFRQTLPEEDSWRCGFLGHIVTELLLDGVLIEQNPDELDEYYRIMDQISPPKVHSVVREVATRDPERLAEFIPLYLNERFLEDYIDDARMLRRINQVMKRVSLEPLPTSVLDVLADGREVVRNQQEELLPPTLF